MKDVKARAKKSKIYHQYLESVVNGVTPHTQVSFGAPTSQKGGLYVPRIIFVILKADDIKAAEIRQARRWAP